MEYSYTIFVRWLSVVVQFCNVQNQAAESVFATMNTADRQDMEAQNTHSSRICMPDQPAFAAAAG